MLVPLYLFDSLVLFFIGLVHSSYILDSLCREHFFIHRTLRFQFISPRANLSFKALTVQSYKAFTYTPLHHGENDSFQARIHLPNLFHCSPHYGSLQSSGRC